MRSDKQDVAWSVLCTLSIVSHRQAGLVENLLRDLKSSIPADFEIIITINVPEDESVYEACELPIRVIRNAAPKGFGANHNSAFGIATGKYFAVVNPDIRCAGQRLTELLQPFREPLVAASAPWVVNGEGKTEDSARRFPTLLTMASRLLSRPAAPDYEIGATPVLVDWVAGMFIVFRRQAFAEVGGFDERRFFMYYEDVDLCKRLRKAGWRIVLQPSVRVCHDAQRESHRNVRYLRWHIVSAIRYLSGF